MASVETPKGDKIKKPKTRSPNYPSIGLERAIEMTAGIYNEYKTHPIPVLLLHKRWGYKEGSGIANQAVAALKAYGLVAVDGVTKDRKIIVTKAGQRIVGNAPDRAELLKAAALAPKIHREVLGYYGDKGLPVDDLLRQYLVWERPDGQRFNPDTVNEFIERFRATLAFAGVSSIDKMEGEEGSGDEPEDEDADQNDSGQKRGPQGRLKLARGQRNRTMSAGLKEDVFSLDNGQAVVVQWPEHMDPALSEDVQDWLKIIGRKIKRAFEAPPPADESDENE